MSARPCDNHLDRASAFTCMACNLYACTECVKHEWVKDHFEDRCLKCNRLMEKVTRAVVDEPLTHDRGVPELLAQLPSIAGFPVRKATLFMLIGLALICAPLYWAVEGIMTPGLSILGLLLILTIEASVYFRIVVQSAYGKADIEPPDATDLAMGLFAPGVRYLATLVPILLAILWFGEQAIGSAWGGILLLIEPSLILDYPGPAALFFGGIILWPLLTLIAAMNESVLAIFNPSTWVACAKIMGTTYLVGSLCFYGIVAFEYLVFYDLLRTIADKVDIPVLTRLVILFVSYLPFALRARLLGVMVEPYIGHE